MMRWGILAAGLCAIVAQPANAAKFVRYTVSGLGDITITNNETGIPDGGLGKFTYSITVDVEPTVNEDGPYISTGKSFFYGRPSRETIVGSDVGRLFAQERIGDTGSANLSVSFSPLINPNGAFPIGNPRNVSGTFYFDNGGRGTGAYDIRGNVNRLVITEVAEYADSTTTFEASAVPEPATWGMMILGFGVVGASMRRRKADVRNSIRFA